MKDRWSIIDILIGIFLMISLSFYYVLLRTEIVKLGYELSSARKNRNELLEMNTKLKLELSALEAPVRIEPLAKKMGLNYPTQNQIQEIKSNGF
jgi:cell division protein FtsL